MARSRKKRGGRGLVDVATPSLNSLMDIVTIILVYFVKTFAVSPIMVQDPSIELPISTSLEPPRDAVVVMVTGAHRRDVGPNGEAITVPAIPTISVDDELILQLTPDFELPAGSLERQFVIRALKQKLLEVRKLQGVTLQAMGSDAEFSGQIVFVIDKNVPYRTLSKALVTSAEAGYPNFSFAIVKDVG